MVAEIGRVAAKGCRAISMPELPHIQGLPSYQSDYWDPFFRAVCDQGLVMCLHIGMGLDAIDMGPDFSPDNFMVLVDPGHGARRAGPAVGAGDARGTPI